MSIVNVEGRLIRPGRCPEIPELLKFVLKLELGPEIRTYILKFFTRFHNFFKNTHHFICNMA